MPNDQITLEDIGRFIGTAAAAASFIGSEASIAYVQFLRERENAKEYAELQLVEGHEPEPMRLAELPSFVSPSPPPKYLPQLDNTGPELLTEPQYDRSRGAWRDRS